MRFVVEHIRELHRYRVLIEALVWREVKARYRGSVLGYLWTLLNPLLLLIVYRLVFTRFTRGVEMHDYAAFCFIGILPWLWLGSSVTNGCTSIAQGGSLITRVCMPPQVLPAVAVLSNLVNFVLALPFAVAAAALYGLYPSPYAVLLPLAIAAELVFLYGLALVLSSLTVRFRDIQFLVQNLLMVWFFLTPIAYPLGSIEGHYRLLALANPATYFIVPYQQMLFTEAAFRDKLPRVEYLPIAAAGAIVMLVIGVSVFESRRDTLAEEI